MAQTSYSQYGAASFRGMLDGIGAHNVRSYAAEAAVAVGAPVKLGADPAKQVLTATTGANTIGFALHDHARQQSSAGVVEYAIKESVSVLTQGRMWALTSDAVVAGAVANLTVADGTLTDAAVAAGIEAFTKITVTFITATTAAGLALVEIK
jgi:hypothetical protein